MQAVPAATQIPAAIRAARDYEHVAREYLQAPTFEYIAGGSGRDLTAAANLAAFERLTVCPRVLRHVADGQMRVVLPGAQLTHPILLAPVAYQALAHPGGERETARAARATSTCMVASTLSSCLLEEIAVAAAEVPHWFQLYIQPSAAATADLVRRAEASAYGALVVTLDAALQIPSHRAVNAGFQLPSQVRPANLSSYDVAAAADSGGEGRLFQAAARSSATWHDLEQLRSMTSLPIWVKGVMHPDDARGIKAGGIDGIVVSNHGGRGLEGAPSSLSALGAIRDSVGANYPLLFDGGIRSGQDVFKAIALGADAVLVGRLQMYALAVAGALGVAHMLRLLREELEVCMALTGCSSLAEVRTARVQQAPC